MSLTDTAIPLLRGPVPLTHLLLRTIVQPGDRVADATCGNGKDTVLLAQLVGPDGHVFAFDIQPTALERTRQRLAEADLTGQATLLLHGHEQLATLLAPPLNAVVFNLGWLPGGDRSLVTRPATTMAALQGSLRLLAPGGILLITCYPGHDGGAEEAASVQDWAGQLPATTWHAWRMGQLNTSCSAPFCLLVQKTCPRETTSDP